MARSRRAKTDDTTVGELPFDPRATTFNGFTRTEYGRPRIAWDYLVKLFNRWPTAPWPSYLFSDPLYEEDSSQWIPRLPLGRGGYGKVALWSKIDDMGNVLKDVAIKECLDAPINMYDVGLTREAVFHGHLTARKAAKDCFTRLFAYKFFPHPSDTKGDKSRLYQQYCPHSDLNPLMARYRAFNTYLPELFLWRTLCSIAEAGTFLKDCPCHWRPIAIDGQVPNDFGQNEASCIFHFDLKPGNIFVGPNPRKSARQGDVQQYPAIYVSDFGGATVKEGRSRRRRSFQFGTPGHQAPEQLYFGGNWSQGNLYGLRDNTFRFDERTNTFCIGKVIYNLMTLEYQENDPFPRNRPPGIENAGNEDDATTAQAQSQQEDFESCAHFLPIEDFAAEAPYSSSFKKLIYECLAPRISDRPSAQALLHRARLGYKLSLRDEEARADEEDYNPADSLVYFNNADMNESGLTGRLKLMSFFETKKVETMKQVIGLFQSVRHLRPGVGNPEDPALKPPYRLWHEHYDNEAKHVKLVRQQMKNSVGEQDLYEDRVIRRVGEWAYFNERGGGANISPQRKRAGSWNENDEKDRRRRSALQSLRHNTADYTGDKPMRLLEHIFDAEKGDLKAAEEVLKWLYSGGRQPGPWASDKINRALARVVVKAWKNRYPTRVAPSRKQCLYFVVKQEGAGLRGQLALEKMNEIFKPEAKDLAASSDDNRQQRSAYEMYLIRALRLKIGAMAREDRKPQPQQRFEDIFLARVLTFCEGDVKKAMGHLERTGLLEAGDHQLVDSQGWDAFGNTKERREEIMDALGKWFRKQVLETPGTEHLLKAPGLIEKTLNDYLWNIPNTEKWLLQLLLSSRVRLDQDGKEFLGANPNYIHNALNALQWDLRAAEQAVLRVFDIWRLKGYVYKECPRGDYLLGEYPDLLNQEFARCRENLERAKQVMMDHAILFSRQVNELEMKKEQEERRQEEGKRGNEDEDDDSSDGKSDDDDNDGESRPNKKDHRDGSGGGSNQQAPDNEGRRDRDSPPPPRRSPRNSTQSSHDRRKSPARSPQSETGGKKTSQSIQQKQTAATSHPRGAPRSAASQSADDHTHGRRDNEEPMDVNNDDEEFALPDGFSKEDVAEPMDDEIARQERADGEEERRKKDAELKAATTAAEKRLKAEKRKFNTESAVQLRQEVESRCIEDINTGLEHKHAGTRDNSIGGGFTVGKGLTWDGKPLPDTVHVFVSGALGQGDTKLAHETEDQVQFMAKMRQDMFTTMREDGIRWW